MLSTRRLNDQLLKTPLRASGFVVLSGLAGTLGFVVASMRPLNNSLPVLAACFVVAAVGLVGMFWIGFNLQNDVQNERWSEAELAPIRAAIAHPAWKLAMAVLLILMLCSMALRGRHNDYFWAVYFLLQAQTQLGAAFRPPRKKTGSRASLDWSRVGPLQSEHWGKR